MLGFIVTAGIFTFGLHHFFAISIERSMEIGAVVAVFGVIAPRLTSILSAMTSRMNAQAAMATGQASGTGNQPAGETVAGDEEDEDEEEIKPRKRRTRDYHSEFRHAIEQFEWSGERALVDPSPIRIIYVDAFGNETDRVVRPLCIGFERKRRGRVTVDRFLAYCTEAEDTRTFVLDRVERAFDRQTREEIYDLGYFLIERAKK